MYFSIHPDLRQCKSPTPPNCSLWCYIHFKMDGVLFISSLDMCHSSVEHLFVFIFVLVCGLVDRPTQLIYIFWYLFVELVVATPVEWQNFVSVTPAATKSILDSFFSSKYPFYVYHVHETAKNRANKQIETLKKPVLSILLDSVLVQIKLN